MKSKLFISLSLLTAAVSMNASSFQVAQLMKHSVLAAKDSVKSFMNKKMIASLAIGTTATYGLHAATMYADEQIGLYGEQTNIVDTHDNVYEHAKNIALDNVLQTSVMPVAQISTCQTKAEFDADVQNTRFGTFKAQLNNGFNFVKNQSLNGINLAKTYKKTSAVAGAAVVAGLGYMGYKKLAAKYAQAKTPVVTTPVVVTPVKKAVKPTVKKSTSCRRNGCGRRK